MTYIFEHIPKTGGTTINFSYLAGAFRPEELVIVPGFPDPNRQELLRLAALPENEKRRIKVIAGHGTGCLRKSFPHARYITIVRQPVARVISGYRHLRNHRDAWEYGGRLVSENRIGLLEFVRDDIFARKNPEVFSMQNGQAKTVLGAAYKADIDEETIEQAIRSRYHLIGHTERLELLLFVLHVLDGFPLVLFNNRLVLKEREGLEPSPEDLAAIERYNRVDALLHRLVCREFERRMQTIWNPRRESLYHEYLAALQRFQRETKGLETTAPVLFDFVKAEPGEELSPGVFSLADAVKHNQSTLVGAGPIEVTTNPKKWAYAVSFPFRSEILHAGAFTGPLLIRIDARVERGQIGVGFVDRSMKSYLTAEVCRTSEDGDAHIDLTIDQSRHDIGGRLVLRNIADDTPSSVTLRAIRTYKAERVNGDI